MGEFVKAAWPWVAMGFFVAVSCAWISKKKQ